MLRRRRIANACNNMDVCRMRVLYDGVVLSL